MKLAFLAKSAISQLEVIRTLGILSKAVFVLMQTMPLTRLKQFAGPLDSCRTVHRDTGKP